MKKNLFYLLLCTLCLSNLSLVAQNIDLKERKKLLVGTWEVEPSLYFVIEENMDLHLKEEEKTVKSGNWKISDDGLTFFILENKEVIEEMNIISVDQYEFIFLSKNDKQEVVLTRYSGNDAITTEEMTKLREMTTGTWKALPDLNTELGMEEEEIIIQFLGDGSVISSKDPETEAVWEISKNGKYLNITTTNDMDTERFKIISITKDKIMLQEGADKINLIRQ